MVIRGLAINLSVTRIVIVLPLEKASEIADVISYAPVGALGAVYVHNVIG